MPSIYILDNYNNYFNREIKTPKQKVAEYPNPYYYENSSVLNFNPDDGVSTSYLSGRQSNPYDGLGDYLLYSDDGINVSSRWFIIESKRKCAGQYDLSLKRDVIADNYDSVITSDCFVEKATVNDDSKLIYNQEAMTTNQIKTSETQLMDESKMAWIVGFVNRDAEARTIAINSTVIPDKKYNSFEDWPYYKYIGNGVASSLSTLIKAYIIRVINESITEYQSQKQVVSFTTTRVNIKDTSENFLTANAYKYRGTTSDFKTYLNPKRSTIRGALNSNLTEYFTNIPEENETDFYGIQAEEGKILEIGGRFYNITLDRSNSYSQTADIKSGTTYDTWNTIFNDYGNYISGTPIYKASLSASIIKPVLTPVVEGEYTIDYPAKTAHLINKDAPFDLFCIPYSDDMTIQVGSSMISANKQFAMSIASELGRNLAADCFDIQLLPYCPMTGYTVIGKLFDINSDDSNRYTAIKKDNDTVYWMFWSASNSGTFNIQKKLLVENKKIENQCNMYRLVSPNYSGQFEFNLAKNGGINYFNVDYTYLPVSSYIHVNPDFKELYGNDYNDARGLICQGDFSIMYLSDAWINYQQQNKNYNQIFGREIQNMDINRKYQRGQEIASGITGALSTGATLTLINPIAGAIGTALSAGGAAGDIAISEKLYQESKLFKKDIHDMQLENIQALPNSIAKTTAYTENNKIFPTLEYYTCTDEEKQLVAKAISNMGMTVNAMGKPQDYISNEWNYGTIQDRGFFKATLIKIDNLNEDYHMAQSIAQELSLGVYIKGE